MQTLAKMSSRSVNPINNVPQLCVAFIVMGLYHDDKQLKTCKSLRNLYNNVGIEEDEFRERCAGFLFLCQNKYATTIYMVCPANTHHL